jgi:DNA-binding transcriptional MerR regulator
MLDQRTYSVAELERATGFDRRTIVYYIQFGLIARPGRRGPKTRYPGEAMTRLQFVRGVRDLQERGELLNVTLGDIRRAIDRTGIERISALVEQHMPVDQVAPLLGTGAETGPGAPHGAADPWAAAPAAVGAPLPAATSLPAAEPTAPAPAQGPAQPPRERRAFGLADANVRQRFGVGALPSTRDTPSTVDAPVPAPTPALDAPASPTGPGPAGGGVDLGELGRMLRELEIRPAMTGRRLAPGAAEQWTEIPITSRVYLSVRGLGSEDAALAEAVGRALKRVLRFGQGVSRD